MKIITVGIDLANNALQVHGANAQGKAVLQMVETDMGDLLALLRVCRNRLSCGSVEIGSPAGL